MYGSGLRFLQNSIAVTLLNKVLLLSAVLVTFSYFFGYQTLFRPISGGPATNPLTLILFFLAAFATSNILSKNLNFVLKLMLWTGLTLALVRLVETATGHQWLQYFVNEIILNRYYPEYANFNETGSNTAAAFTCYFLVLLSITVEKKSFGLLMLSIMATIILFSVYGYALAYDPLYNAMSYTTLVMLSVLLITGWIMLSSNQEIRIR